MMTFEDGQLQIEKKSCSDGRRLQIEKKSCSNGAVEKKSRSNGRRLQIEKKSCSDDVAVGESHFSWMYRIRAFNNGAVASLHVAKLDLLIMGPFNTETQSCMSQA